jgi:NADH dehydrogenase [ubiquinone] 1 alpha subcomplex assembly factor 5
MRKIQLSTSTTKIYNYSQKVFNETQKIIQRNRTPHLSLFPQVQYIRQTMAERLADRLYDIKRPIRNLLDLNGGPGYLRPYLEKDKVQKYHVLDPSRDLLYAGFELERDAILARNTREAVGEDDFPEVTRWLTQDFYDIDRRTKILASGQIAERRFGKEQDDEEVDGIASYVSTHWINDLTLYFQKVYERLEANGLFMGAMIGGESLYELRSSFLLYEQQVCSCEGAFQESHGDVTTNSSQLHSDKMDLRSRISPMIRMQDLANLLATSHFELVTLDFEEMRILFPTLKHIMKELGVMGESVMPASENFRKNTCLSRSMMQKTEAIYKEYFGQSQESKEVAASDDGVGRDGLVVLPVTLDIFWWIAWKPSKTSPQPLKRGTAQTSLKDVFAMKVAT